MDSSNSAHSGESQEDPLKKWKEDQKRYMDLQEKIIHGLILLFIVGVLIRYMFF